MATYTEVKGVPVRKVGAEPSPLVEGEVFYRTDTQKYYVVIDSGGLTAAEIDVTQVV
jgi:hypothetical protein